MATGVSTTTVWQLTTMDEYKRITQASIGGTASSWSFNSSSNLLSSVSATSVQGYTYSFDANTGNLSSRTNTLKSKTETFGYDTDNLDRLVSVTGPVNLSMGYTTNKNGNIQSKGDAGTYEYHPTKVYAVNKITSGQNISNDVQIIDYYSFEKVAKITEGTGSTQKTADFDYNADLQRIRMVLKTNGTVTKTRYYFGSSCEREVVGTTTTQYIWIVADAYTAVAVAQKVGTGAWTVYNIFRDHLGTITHLKTGSTITEYSFDAWGRRRDKDDWTTTLTSEPALFADRGFTGHEYLDDFKLYNMNGRLYDPVVGRFLSPDPYIQDPGFTQNLNRYSYCLNNPLKFNDPTGEFAWWYFLGQLAGNYLFNMADNTINKKMPMDQAAKQFNFNMNYSPGSNRFFTPGVDAQMAAWNTETSSKPVYYQTGSMVLTSYFGGAYDDAYYLGSRWRYVPFRSGVPQGQGGITIDNTAQALGHYLFGDGSPVKIGPKTISDLLNHPDFLDGHNQVMNDKLKKPYFYVDMTWTVFHIGDTRVSYSLDEKNRTITYTLFDGDSFSDADLIDEYFMGKLFGEPAFQSDGLGPKLERFGGIPYYYVPFNITFHY